MALIGVYLVILGLAVDRDLELERERLLEPLELLLEPPRPPPRAASDNSTNTIAAIKRRRSTVERRIFSLDKDNSSLVCLQLFG